MPIPIALLLPLAVMATKPDSVRSLRAARRSGPITIDGKLDEPAWASAQEGSGFIQTDPEPGQPATVATRVRVLWDEDAIYVGVECDDPEPPNLTLSRRDRDVDADIVRVDFDTALDRRTAYHFAVYASGQQIDGLHFNDNDFNADWDAVWESSVARTSTGWSVEMRIPLRVMHVPEGASQFGFNVARYLARRHEDSEWQYTAPELAGKVSRFGALSGIDGIRPVLDAELRPFLSLRGTRTSPAPADTAAPARPGACTSVGPSADWIAAGCLGLDFRVGLVRDLSLLGTLNPDFGEAEVDERVLNLTTFETFFPEKRHFFLEGVDLFELPLSDAWQIFYSRRIGRPPPDASLADGEAILYAPPARPLGAVKLLGNLGQATVGALLSFEPGVSAQVLRSDRVVEERPLAESQVSVAVRARQAVGEHFIGGLTATSVDSFDGHKAHVGALDGAAFDSARDWNLSLQLGGSRLGGTARTVLRDGTVLADGSDGWAASARLGKDAGPLVGSVRFDALSPSFWANDLGFMDRGNLVRLRPSLTLRELRPGPLWRRASLGVGAVEQVDFSGVVDRRDITLNAAVDLLSFWSLRATAGPELSSADDRELGDGTPLERWPGIFTSLELDSDPQRAYVWSFRADNDLRGPFRARDTTLSTELKTRPHPAIETSVGMVLRDTSGIIRRIRAATGVPESGGDPTQVLPPDTATSVTREYLLAPQSARSVSVTLRVTAAITPRLSVQALTQLFTAGIAYGDPLRAVAEPGRRTVRLDELTPARSSDDPPNADVRQAGLDVDLILRWEFMLGSTLFFVYTRQTANELTPRDRGLDFGADLGSLAGPGAITRDTFLVKLQLFAVP
jgi:hypothetical protein